MDEFPLYLIKLLVVGSFICLYIAHVEHDPVYFFFPMTLVAGVIAAYMADYYLMKSVWQQELTGQQISQPVTSSHSEQRDSFPWTLPQ